MSLNLRALHIVRAAIGLLFAGTLLSCGGGGATPAVPQPSRRPVANVADNWIMYGHDSRHTSASQASVNGPLQTMWRYDPQAATGDTFSSTYNAVAAIGGVYVHWFQSAPTILGAGPSVDGVSVGGLRIWSFVAKKDFDEGHWLSIFGNNVVFQDDEEGFLSSATGKPVSQGAKQWSATYDMWGETIPDTSGLYAANTFLADGSDLFVYSLDATGAARWSALKQKSSKYSQDGNGALVLSNGTLFYAASYSDQSPHPTGIYALNASSGAQLAYAATTPAGEMSADANNIYLVESPSNLVARSQSDLHKVWSVSTSSPLLAAPVLANGFVIIGTGSGVEAHDPASGRMVWRSPVQANGYGQSATALCAALASNTLVVTAVDGLHVLNLSNGSDLWHGAVGGAQGGVTNPIIVNDPSRGATVYVTDSRGIIALTPH